MAPPALQARRRLWMQDRTADNISGLVVRPWTQALMIFARRSLATLSVSEPPLGLSGLSCAGLTCFHQQLRSAIPGGWYLLDLDRGCRVPGLRQAVTTSGPADRYSVPWARIAHAIRACFAASATAATFTCRRSSSRRAQAALVSVFFSTTRRYPRAPCTSSVRKYPSPRRVIWPSRSLPPLEYCRGVIPSEAA